MWNSKEQIVGDLKAMVKLGKLLMIPWYVVTGLLFAFSWTNPNTGLFVYFLVCGALLVVFANRIGTWWFEYGTSMNEITNELLHLEKDFRGSMMGLNLHRLQWLTRLVGATLLIYGIIRLIF